MDFRPHLRRILSELNLTEWELAERLGLHRGAIVRLLTQERHVKPLECLLIAGLRSDSSDRDYWLQLSGLTNAQRHLLSKAVGSPVMDLTSFPPEIGADIAAFLDFAAHAHPERRKAMRAILRDWSREV
jgi:hypothetical protein